jgi:hypothetical protein
MMNVHANIKRRKTPTMEYTTLTIETTSPGQGMPAKPQRLWIEQQERVLSACKVSWAG